MLYPIYVLLLAQLSSGLVLNIMAIINMIIKYLRKVFNIYHFQHIRQNIEYYSRGTINLPLYIHTHISILYQQVCKNVIIGM